MDGVHPINVADEGECDYVLIQNGIVVNADFSRKADVLVRAKDGKIVDITPSISAIPSESTSISVPPNSTVRTIDASDQYLLPGGIDPHVHLALTFMGQVSEPPSSGTRCAIAGGTTLLMDFIIPPVSSEPGVLLETYGAWMEKYSTAPPSCHYSFHGCITQWDDATMPQQLEELRDVAGVNSFKMFMAYKNALMLDDASLLRGFAHCKRLGLLPAVHAENGELVSYLQDQIVVERGIVGPEGHPMSRPDRVESEACERAITIASQLNTPLMIVHNTTEGSVDAIRRGQHDGVRVLGEATIVHLMLDESRYFRAGHDDGAACREGPSTWEYRAAHVLSPPLRSRRNVESLWNGIDAGTLTQVVTDHCAFTTEQKKNGGRALTDFRFIPNGCPGIEERMPLLWTHGVGTGRITPMQFVALTSTNAAKTYNLYPQKGSITVGADADLVVWDPAAAKTISASTHSSCLDVNIFEGMELKGLPRVVLLNGKVVVDNFQIVNPGQGKYVRREPFAEALYSGLDHRDTFRTTKQKAVTPSTSNPTIPAT